MYNSPHAAADFFAENSSAMDPDNPSDNPNDGYELGVKDIGMSVPLGISAQNIAGIYSKIRMGTGKIEIQFAGYKSGQRNAQTPEQYGEDQRQAMREMAIANEVEFTTHASFSMMGMMGRDQYGNFSNPNSRENLFELKKAIDFQGDVSLGKGGSVVMHTGEFDRGVTDMYLDDETQGMNLARDSSGRLLFKQFPGQEAAAKFEVMDDRSSQKMPIYKDKLTSVPVWNRAKHDYDGVDNEGNRVHIKEGDYINYEGHKILDPYDPRKGRVPEQDEEKGTYKFKLQGYDYFRREALEYNKHFEEKRERKPTFYEKMYAEEAMARAPQELDEAYARGWGTSLGARSQENIKNLKKLREAKAFYEKLDKNLSEQEKQKLFMDTPISTNLEQLGIIPRENKYVLDMINDSILSNQKELEYSSTSAYAQEARAVQQAEDKAHLVHPIKRLEKWGIRNYAEAGIHAMRRSKDPNQPITVAIEHIFPEQFGGHPEELKWVIKKSRERMVDMLTKKEIEGGESLSPVEWDQDRYDGKKNKFQPNPFYTGMSKSEAKKRAEQHIKATIDTGHINLWRKYWQEDPRLSPEQNDKAFNDWAVKTIGSLAKDGMVGNVHLADNYGYGDDHLAPGQGNAPVREIMNIIKKNGYDKAITVEPGADATVDQGDFHGLMKTWRFFGSPIYGHGAGGAAMGAPGRFGDLQHSYLGHNQAPYFMFGSYSPSQDWQLWSQIPME